MDKRRLAVLCILAAAAVDIMVFRMLVPIKRYTYNTTEEVFKNPMMGFAPNADYPEAVGDNTLVYLDVTWRELEPEEGVYDFAGIEERNFLERWRSEGKKVVFRFVCDEPSEEKHMDIPDWLYEKTGDGTFYDTDYGRGYSPDYSNETLIAYHERAIRALGEQYGQDFFFCFIELGSVGHWGEWHVKYSDGIKRLPGENILKEYVEPYITAFPNSKLLMRRPFPYVSLYGMGVYNDMTGHGEDTGRWLSWIEEGGTYKGPEEPMELIAVPKLWERAPVGGEFTSAYPLVRMLIDNQEETLKLLYKSHMTFIGPMCPIANKEEKEYPKEVYAVLSRLGYRYGVSECSVRWNKISGQAKLCLTIENNGAAPMYYDWPVCVYLMSEDGEVLGRFETDIKLTQIAGGGKKTMNLRLSVDKDSVSEDGFPVFAVGIENPETNIPSVYLDMETKHSGMYYFLN